MFFIFQETYIWDGANPVAVDESCTPVRIKAKSEEKARRRLPKGGMGQKWILIRTETKGSSS